MQNELRIRRGRSTVNAEKRREIRWTNNVEKIHKGEEWTRNRKQTATTKTTGITIRGTSRIARTRRGRPTATRRLDVLDAAADTALLLPRRREQTIFLQKRPADLYYKLNKNLWTKKGQRFISIWNLLSGSKCVKLKPWRNFCSTLFLLVTAFNPVFWPLIMVLPKSAGV